MALPSQSQRGGGSWRATAGSTYRAGGIRSSNPVITLLRNVPTRAYAVGALALAFAGGVGYFAFWRGASSNSSGSQAILSGDVAHVDLPPRNEAISTTPSSSAALGASGLMGSPTVIVNGRDSGALAPTGGGSNPSQSTLDQLIANAGRNAAITRQNDGNLSPALPSPEVIKGNGTEPSTDPLSSSSPSVITPPSRALPATPAVSASGAARDALEKASRLLQQNKPVEARTLLNSALLDAGIGQADRGPIRAQLAAINETLLFSPTVFADDTITDTHIVASGENLGRIVRRQGLPVDWRFLVRINRLASENSIRVGQKLKIIRMPLHAVVHKDAYRMDIFAGKPPTGSTTLGPDGQEQDWIYIRSFRVGLGESNGTPIGTFVVRPNSKLINPKWVNPRTGEVFQADDPKNPIGEHWIGLDGADENTKKFTGYGVHGTIDPESIGLQRSMGCVRLAKDDIALVYELLVERISTVKIIP